MTEKKSKNSEGISRRDFLKDAGLLVGGTAVGSAVLMTSCGGETETVTKTKTVTDTVSKFVCPYDGQEFDTLAELQAHIEAEHVGETPIALNVVSLIVNRQEYELQVGPTDVLRDILRDRLGLTSIKDMCNGFGACGSCTVIMDGRPVLSCMVLAIECNGAIIETSEGIADAEHPLVEAYITNSCMQCGYCTPGFLVTAKALLDHNPNPAEADIRDALGGNICRCGTYPEHIRAVLEATGSL